MALLSDIIEEATAKAVDLPRLLRLCLLLSSRLKNEVLRQWVRHELDGYPKEVDVPPYRVLRARNRGFFIGHFHSWEATLDIPLSVLPEELRPLYREAKLHDSIAEYADLVDKTNADNSGLHIPWPVHLAVKYAGKVATNGQCTSAWMELSPSELVGMLDQIKTRVLSFALEIEETFPQADVAGGATTLEKAEEARVTKIFNTTINGSVQNFAAGNADVTQSAVANVRTGDWDSLVSLLRGAGLQDSEITELQTAIQQDAHDGEPQIGTKARQWLSNLTLKAGQGLSGVSTEVVGGLVTQALLTYFGVSGG